MRVVLSMNERHWPLREPFVISRQIITDVATIAVTLRDVEGRIGQGAAPGLDYAGETVATMRAQIEAWRPEIEHGIDRNSLLDLLPPGGARAAVDAALWDLEAKSTGISPFAAAGVAARPIHSATTIALCEPPVMEDAARAAAGSRWLKLKVGRDDPVAAVKAARRGAPDARFIVDPNQAWNVEMLNRYTPALEQLGVELIEQPTAVGCEAELARYEGNIPLCADESCGSIDDLETVAVGYAAINIKLDKTGGLTAALNLADAAETLGLKLMVGCMLGPSLSIAPAMVLAQRCIWIDLDAPPFLLYDDPQPFEFRDGIVGQPHRPELWG